MLAHPITAAVVAGSPVSGIFGASNACNISFQFNCANHTSGNGVLTVLGSNDGVTYTAIAFIDPTVANTNAQNITRVLSKTLSSNASAIGTIENWFKFQFIKFTVTITTDGTYDVYVWYDYANKD